MAEHSNPLTKGAIHPVTNLITVGRHQPHLAALCSRVKATQKQSHCTVTHTVKRGVHFFVLRVAITHPTHTRQSRFLYAGWWIATTVYMPTASTASPCSPIYLADVYVRAGHFRRYTPRKSFVIAAP